MVGGPAEPSRSVLTDSARSEQGGLPFRAEEPSRSLGVGASAHAMEGLEAESACMATLHEACQGEGTPGGNGDGVGLGLVTLGEPHNHAVVGLAAPGRHEEEDAMAVRCGSLLLEPQPDPRGVELEHQPQQQQQEQQQGNGVTGLAADEQLPDGVRQGGRSAHEAQLGRGKQHQKQSAQRSKVARQCHGHH